MRDANPDSGWFPVHEQDIADVAVAALLEDGHAGKAYDVNGPELINLRDQVRAIAAAIGADFLLGFANYDGTPIDPDADGVDYDGGGSRAVAHGGSGYRQARADVRAVGP